MNQSMSLRKSTFGRKILSTLTIFCFALNSILPAASAQSIAGLNLPKPGTMITMSPVFEPAMIKGLIINPDNPLRFDFLVNRGQENLDDAAFQEESTKLIKYFMAALTVPEEELWVNLSPYEQDRIIPESFGVTEMGRDLLGQDYMLKQLTASLMYPEKDLGNTFWNRVYEKAQAQFGTTEIPMNTFNKIWIVPDDASIGETNKGAFIFKSHLKVMLEEDYVALNKNLGNEHYGLDNMPEKDAQDVSAVTSDVVRQILIPEIEKEINEGENFANLRQMFNAMVLATWFKVRLKESLLGQVYSDQNKTAGIDLEDKNVKEKIYDQYLQAFKKGVYDYIKEDYDAAKQDVLSRKYISGGFTTRGPDGAMFSEEIDKRWTFVMPGVDLTGLSRKTTTVAELPPGFAEQLQERSLAIVTAVFGEVPHNETAEAVRKATTIRRGKTGPDGAMIANAFYSGQVRETNDKLITVGGAEYPQGVIVLGDKDMKPEWFANQIFINVQDLDTGDIEKQLNKFTTGSVVPTDSNTDIVSDFSDTLAITPDGSKLPAFELALGDIVAQDLPESERMAFLDEVKAAYADFQAKRKDPGIAYNQKYQIWLSPYATGKVQLLPRHFQQLVADFKLSPNFIETARIIKEKLGRDVLGIDIATGTVDLVVKAFLERPDIQKQLKDNGMQIKKVRAAELIMQQKPGRALIGDKLREIGELLKSAEINVGNGTKNSIQVDVVSVDSYTNVKRGPESGIYTSILPSRNPGLKSVSLITVREDVAPEEFVKWLEESHFYNDLGEGKQNRLKVILAAGTDRAMTAKEQLIALGKLFEGRQVTERNGRTYTVSAEVVPADSDIEILRGSANGQEIRYPEAIDYKEDKRAIIYVRDNEKPEAFLEWLRLSGNIEIANPYSRERNIRKILAAGADRAAARVSEARRDGAMLASNVKNMLRRSEGLIRRMREGYSLSKAIGNDKPLEAAFEEARVDLKVSNKKNQPHLFVVAADEEPREMNVQNLSDEDIRSALLNTDRQLRDEPANGLKFITDEEVRKIKNREPFNNFSNETRDRNSRLYKVALKSGILGVKYVATNIKRFSPDSHLAYIEKLKEVLKEYNGHVIVLLSVEADTDVLAGDGAGQGTMMAAIRQTLGQDFIDRNEIDLITDGGLKTRGGLQTAVYGYNGFMATPDNKPFYVRSLEFLGQVRMQNKDWGKGRVFWTASDGDYKIGNLSYGAHHESELENDGSWDMVIHGDQTEVFPKENQADIFAQLDQLDEKLNEDQIRQQLGPENPVVKALDFIRERKIHELGNNFTDPQTGILQFFQEKPTPLEILRLLKRFNNNSIIPNAFLVIYTKDALKKHMDFYDEPLDPQDENSLRVREVGDSYFRATMESRFNFSVLDKTFKNPQITNAFMRFAGLKKDDAGKITYTPEAAVIPNNKIIAANLDGSFDDRGKIKFLTDAFRDRMTGPVFTQNSTVADIEKIPFQSGTIIIDSRVGKPIKVNGGDTVIVGVNINADEDFYDLSSEGKWEKVSEIEVYSGETVGMVVMADGRKVLVRSLTDEDPKGVPIVGIIQKSFGASTVKAIKAHPRLFSRLLSSDGELNKDLNNYTVWPMITPTGELGYSDRTKGQRSLSYLDMYAGHSGAGAEKSVAGSSRNDYSSLNNPNIVIETLMPQEAEQEAKSGTSGVRGKRGEYITLNMYGRLAKGIALDLLNQIKSGKRKPVNGNKLRILVTYGGRELGIEGAQRMVEVFAAYGFDVTIGDGITTTPASMSLTRKELGEEAFDVSFHVDASHNPVTDNGLKFLEGGVVASDSKVKPYMLKSNNKLGLKDYPRVPIEKVNPAKVDVNKKSLEPHRRVFNQLSKTVNGFLAKNRSVRIRLDLMHGAATGTVDVLREINGIEVYRENPMRDPSAPRTMKDDKGNDVVYKPEPTYQNVSQTAAFQDFEANDADGSLYMAIDGDADRLAVWVKKNGKVVELLPNNLGPLFAWYLISKKRTTGDLIAKTLPTTEELDLVAAHFNVPLIRTGVGSKNFGVDSILPRIIVGTEESGHQVLNIDGEIFFDVAVAQAELLLQIMVDEDKNPADILADVHELVGYKKDARQIQVPLTKEQKAGIINKIENDFDNLVAQLIKEIGKGQPAETLVTVPDGDSTKPMSLDEYKGQDAVKMIINEGIYLKYPDLGWMQFRLSGTEEIQRIYTEVENKEEKENFEKAVIRTFGLPDAAMTGNQEVGTPADLFDDELSFVSTQVPLRAGGLRVEQAEVDDVSSALSDLMDEDYGAGEELLGAIKGTTPLTPKAAAVVRNYFPEGIDTRQAAIIASALEVREGSLAFSDVESDGILDLRDPVARRPNQIQETKINPVMLPEAAPAVPGQDQAATAKDEYGGINLNAELLNLQIKRDGNGIPLPANQQPIEQMNIDGFIPFIINIAPVTNLPLLMGINIGREKESEISYNLI